MAAQTDRIIPPAGSTRGPWPWRVPAAVIVALVAAFIAHFVFKPALAMTAPTLSFLGDTGTIAFQATNHTDRPASASLLITAGLQVRGSKIGGRRYAALATTTLAVTLAPREVRNLTWDFPLGAGPPPNFAQVEVVSYSQRGR